MNERSWFFSKRESLVATLFKKPKRVEFCNSWSRNYCNPSQLPAPSPTQGIPSTLKAVPHWNVCICVCFPMLTGMFGCLCPCCLDCLSSVQMANANVNVSVRDALKTFDLFSVSQSRTFAFAFATRTEDRQTRGQAHRHTNMTPQLGWQTRTQTSWTGTSTSFSSVQCCQVGELIAKFDESWLNWTPFGKF